MNGKLMAALSALLLSAGSAGAAPPATVTYSGFLLDAAGNAVTTASTLTFRIYGAPTGGAASFVETIAVAPGPDGYFAAVIGTSSGMPAEVFENPAFLSVQFEGDAQEMTPRIALTSVPSAFSAMSAAVASSVDWSGITNRPAVVTSIGGTAPVTVTSGATPSVSLAPCGTGDVLKWNGAAWACAADLDTATTYTGTAPVSVSGAAISLAGCALNQVLKWNGSAWACATDVDTDISYSAAAGQGLALTGTAFGLAACPAGQILKSSGSAWGCAADSDTDTNTTYSGSAPVTVSGTTIGLASCAVNQVLKWNGSAWACAVDADTDTNTTYGAAVNQGLALAGTAFGLAACPANQVLKSAGTTWACAADADSGGTVTSVTGSLPITSTGGATPVIAIAQAGAAASGYLSSTDWSTFSGKQARVVGSCSGGSSITSIAANGSVTCTTDQSIVFATGLGPTYGGIAGGVPTDSANIGFIGPTATVTVGSGQRLMVVASKSLGSTALGGASDLDVYVCTQSTAAGAPLVTWGGGIFGLQVPQNTRQIFTLSAGFQLPAGSYIIGLCGYGANGLTWNSNEFGYVSAMMYN